MRGLGDQIEAALQLTWCEGEVFTVAWRTLLRFPSSRVHSFPDPTSASRLHAECQFLCLLLRRESCEMERLSRTFTRHGQGNGLLALRFCGSSLDRYI
jgi:hypothetical protein